MFLGQTKLVIIVINHIVYQVIYGVGKKNGGERENRNSCCVFRVDFSSSNWKIGDLWSNWKMCSNCETLHNPWTHFLELSYKLIIETFFGSFETKWIPLFFSKIFQSHSKTKDKYQSIFLNGQDLHRFYHHLEPDFVT